MIYVVRTEDGVLIAATPEYRTAWDIARTFSDDPAASVVEVPIVAAAEVE